MILEVLGDVFAVPLLPSPTPSLEPPLPNPAELDSARAAWAAVAVAWWAFGVAAFGTAAAAAAAWFARKAFLAQKGALEMQHAAFEAELAGRRHERFERALAAAFNMTVEIFDVGNDHFHAGPNDHGIPVSTNQLGAKVRVSNLTGERAIRVVLLFDAPIAIGYEIVDGARFYGDKLATTEGHTIGALAPGQSKEIVVGWDGEAARSHPNLGIHLRWTDKHDAQWSIAADTAPTLVAGFEDVEATK